MKNVRLEFDRKVEEVGTLFLNFPWENEQAYAGWLAQTYYFVRHTTVIMALQAARYGASDLRNHNHILSHLSEERDHDPLAFTDLKNLGRRIEDFPEYPETALFYQNQYYMVDHQHPSAHLGYSLLLEGIASEFAPEIYQKLLKAYGEKTKKIGEFMRVHSAVDQDHYSEGAKLLIDLNERQAHDALRNLEQSSLLYIKILDRIKDETVRTRTVKTA